MRERTSHGLRALAAFAALQLAACMQGQVGSDEDEALALEEPAGTSPGIVAMDGGLAMPMSDSGMTHTTDGSTHAHAADAGAHAHGPDGGMTMSDAPCNADYPRYRPGLSVKAGDMTVLAVSMVPAPPRQRVPNDWVLQLFDASGTPVADATIANATSYMLVHGHSGNSRPIVVPQQTPGQFKLDNIDFKMRGPWEVLFDVTRQGGRPTLVTFKICVE